MDPCWTDWLSEWFDEDAAFINENTMDESIDPFTIKSFSSYPSFSSNKHNESLDQKPPKKLKTTNWNSSFEPEKTTILASNNSSSSSVTISFANDSASPPFKTPSDHFYGNTNVSSSIYSQEGYKILEGNKSASINTTRTGVQAQDHVLAERKRRERLTKRFISLAALIPHLTKTDKASVLADAIKYIKELKERVEMLEGEAKEQNYAEMFECSLIAKRDIHHANVSLPEIEVKILDKSLLIRIYSKNQSGFIVKALREVEKLNLNIISSNVVPFANNTLLFTTIISQMDDKFNMTADDLSRNLHSAIQEFMSN